MPCPFGYASISGAATRNRTQATSLRKARATIDTTATKVGASKGNRTLIWWVETTYITFIRYSLKMECPVRIELTFEGLQPPALPIGYGHVRW